MTDSEKTPDASAMASRFSGDAGRSLLLEVISDTTLFRGVSDLEELVDGCQMMDVRAGGEIIVQGATDNSLYLVVSGAFDICVNGRRVTTRGVGSHVGEMALIDGTARRTATVKASEHSLVLQCSEELFSRFADAHPKTWRRIAVELSRRLTERNRMVKSPRTQPVVFVGCSKEAIEVAREVQAAFDHDAVAVEIWTDGVFNPSKTAIEDLTDLMERIDFAVIILTPDDRIESRDAQAFGPRDNVILELGLAIGAIGRERTLMLVPRGTDFKLPSDLLGVKLVDYPIGETSTPQARLGPACNEIRKVINRLGPL